MDLGEKRSELARLAERLSELAVEQSTTRRERDQIIVDLYHAGVDPEEIACLAHLMPIDVHRLVQERADRSSGRGHGAPRTPRNGATRA